ncbi:hypothetical protein [Enhygromyxa salina]|uniref:hypothetical protein n=1 Tax=Enhygromyxa salina TaxID=215803 RepID=UPI000D093B61|nr:hypothetical protein [Enhygromyxa salina]
MTAANDGGRASVERGLALIIVLLVTYRLAYHASYLGEVPFTHATFADGAMYEQAARDILDHPPLGTQAFYLQGAYAYLLALGMAIRPWPSFGLIVQLIVAFAALALFHRSALKLWGRRAGLVSSIALLAYPGLAFYENKHLSAELGVACNILVIAAFVAVLARAAPDPSRPGLPDRRLLLASLGLGAASGLATLARPNMILALPFTLLALALVVRRRAGERPRRAVALVLATTLLGTTLALAPMAARNLAVTGSPDVQPVHGGGTSFFIGNNPKSRGVWNDGDLLSARLGTESHELALALGIDPTLPERERAREIGEALYARSLDWIADNPGAWLKLELHKLWLTTGDQQLTQDYDWLGERELLPWAHRVGVSFSILLALGLLGAGAVLGRRWLPPAAEDDQPPPTWTATSNRAALGWFVLGQLLAPLAANLLYFTSAQHRLPLVVPLALLSGPGLLALIAWARAKLGREPVAPEPTHPPLPTWLVVLAGVALIQGPWPRSHREHPHPVHYYNLAMVQDSIGEPLDALASLNRAIELRPRQPIFHMRRAHLRLRLEDFDGVDQDLALVFDIAGAEGAPDWVVEQAELDRHSLAIERALRSR